MYKENSKKFVTMRINEFIKKIEKKATVAQIAFWYMFASACTKGLAAISTPIFTRLMSKTEYGLFNNFNSWISILSILLSLDFASSIARAKYDYDEKMRDYIGTVTISSHVIVLICYFLVEFQKSFFIEYFSLDIWSIRVMFVYLLLSPIFDYLQKLFRIRNKFVVFILLSVGTALIRTVCSILLVVKVEDKYWGRVVGYTLPFIVVCIIVEIITVKGCRFDFKYLRYACTISVPLIPHALSGTILGHSDQLMITNICGAEKNALYSLSVSISSLMSAVWVSMNQSTVPWLYDNLQNNDYQNIKKKTRIYLAAFAMILVGLLLLVPELVLLLGGRDYYEVVYIMPPLIVGYLFQFIYSMYVNLEMYEKKTIYVSIATIIAAVSNVALNVLLIPRFGYQAAAYTTLVGYCILLLTHFIVVNLILPQYRNLYDGKFIFLIIGLILMAAVISMILYNYNVVRYCVICVFGVISVWLGVKNKKKLIRFFIRK